MTSDPDPIHVLILGSGEIARCLARLANDAGCAVTVCEAGVGEHDWPAAARLHDQVYADAPWPLPPHTHGIVARGHDRDPASVAALLNQGAARAYLIASSRRAGEVITSARPLLQDPALLERLSAPAGLELGGSQSTEIALSILAEIQWRTRGGSRRPLCELREQRAARDSTRAADTPCPGKRP